ncbi:MAG: hypothetical protein GY862_25925, partial [Gammaproteobacteria bacterium]|nr:hypothetical protein [Gammaproteobacteria bacterium]
SGIAADTRGESLSAGEAGNIRLEAGSLALTNGGIISSITSGPGKGGNIHVQVAGQTDIISTTSTGGRSFIGTNSQAIGDDEDSSPPSFGNAGEVAVESGGLNLENGGTVSSITFSPGDGGNVSLKISGDLTVSGISPDKRSVSLISTDAGSRKIDGPFGNAGTIVIETKNLTVKEEGTVSSTTFGNGQGGKVVINATESVNISGGSPESDFIRGIFAASQSEREDAGNSGKIFLNAKKLYITDNGVIATLAEKGAAGDIEINVADMRLTNQAGIASESFGPGNAGDIRINASNTVRSRNGIITAQAETAGGGNIELAARSLQLVHESPVSSTVIGGEGDGGNVTLNVGSFAALNNSDITARADQGRGGRITVNADVFLRAPDVELNASSNVIGNEGVVEVNAPDLDLSVALFIMPTPFLRDELRQECRNSSGGDAYSKFTIEPLEDIPVPPETLKTIHLID